MFTSLDWLVIVFMILAAVTLLSICLMFLIKNKAARKVFFYIVSVVGLYVSSIGLRIGISGLFYEQIVIGIVTALVSIGAIVLERASRGNEKLLLVARIISALALVMGMLNAFCI